MDEQLALEACQCLWEAVLEKIEAEPSCQFAKFREQYGSIPLRHAMRQQPILEACSSGWRNLTEEQRQALLPFDYEYCPIFLDKCLTISNDSISLRPDWETSLKATIPPRTLVQSHYLKNMLAPLYQTEGGYPIVCDSTPLPTFIVLDCKSGALFAKNFSDYELYDPEAYALGEVKNVGELRFEVDSRLSMGAFNQLMAEIKPMAQQVVDGFTRTFDGDDLVENFTAEAEKAQAQIAEACNRRCADPKNLDSVCPVDELCAGKPLAEVWPSDVSVEDAARALLSQVDTTKVRLIGRPSDLVDCLLNVAERDFREEKGASLCQVHKQALVDRGLVEQSEMDAVEPKAEQHRRRPKM